MKALIAVLLMSVTFAVQAQTLKAQQFEDQWEKPAVLNEDTNWLVLTQTKSAGSAVKEAFTDLELKDLSQFKMLYIADVSGMPGFITSMIAIPKMKDFAFQIGLIRDEEDLEKMQLGEVDEEQVLVLNLKNLEVVSTQSFADKESFLAFLKANVLTAEQQAIPVTEEAPKQ